jgi:hypothetical protein
VVVLEIEEVFSVFFWANVDSNPIGTIEDNNSNKAIAVII